MSPSAPPDDGSLISRAAQWVPPKVTPDPLPRIVDLRRERARSASQFRARTCTGHAVASALEILAGGRYDLSSLPLHWHAKRLDPRTKDLPASNTGASLGYAVEAGLLYGTCLEQEMPFRRELVGMPPHAKSIFQLTAMYRIGGSASFSRQVCRALHAGYPVVLTLDITKAWHRYRGCRLKGKPLDEGLDLPVIDSHSVCLVGYDQAQEVMRFRNSWGPRWGHNGYGELQFSVLDSERVRDLWVCT